MNCPTCSAYNSTDSRYCLGCGAYLTKPAPPQMQYVAVAKSRGTYIVLGLLLGGLGIHNFYIGRNGVAVVQLVIGLISPCLFFIPLVAVYIWVIGELIAIKRDGKGHPLA